MKDWLKENWYKICVVITLAILVMGYISYLNKRNNLAEMDRIDRLNKEARDRILKEKTDKQEYIANQKKACLDIYESEGQKFNNVREWFYSEFDDECTITYKDPKPKTTTQCNQTYNTEGITSSSLKSHMLHDRSACLNGNFLKTF